MDYAAFDQVSNDKLPDDKFFDEKYLRDSELNKNRLINYKNIVAFQTYTSCLSDDSLKALFTIIHSYLKNELFKKQTSHDLRKACEFFTYDMFKTATWSSELYTTFLDNNVLRDIFSFIESV